MEVLKLALAIGLGMVIENPQKRKQLMAGLDKAGSLAVESIKDAMKTNEVAKYETQQTPPSEFR